MKKLLLFALCLAMLVLLSACRIHVDADPWPASPDYAAPANTETIQQQPQEQNITPTEQPSQQEVKPGLNG